MKGICLVRAGRDKGDASAMIKDGEGKRQALRGWLGAVDDVRDPARLLRQEWVSWEEGAGVAVRTDTEEDEVEDGEASRVLVSEFADQLLLVRVCNFFERVLVKGLGGCCLDQGGINGMDVFLRNGDFGPELLVAEPVV